MSTGHLLGESDKRSTCAAVLDLAEGGEQILSAADFEFRERQRTASVFLLVQARHEDRYRDAAHARNHLEAAWRNAVDAVFAFLDLLECEV